MNTRLQILFFSVVSFLVFINGCTTLLKEDIPDIVKFANQTFWENGSYNCSFSYVDFTGPDIKIFFDQNESIGPLIKIKREYDENGMLKVNTSFLKVRISFRINSINNTFDLDHNYHFERMPVRNLNIVRGNTEEYIRAINTWQAPLSVSLPQNTELWQYLASNYSGNRENRNRIRERIIALNPQIQIFADGSPVCSDTNVMFSQFKLIESSCDNKTLVIIIESFEDYIGPVNINIMDHNFSLDGIQLRKGMNVIHINHEQTPDDYGKYYFTYELCLVNDCHSLDCSSSSAASSPGCLIYSTQGYSCEKIPYKCIYTDPLCEPFDCSKIKERGKCNSYLKCEWRGTEIQGTCSKKYLCKFFKQENDCLEEGLSCKWTESECQESFI